MGKPLITQSELQRVLHYDPETGIFRWKMSPDRRAQQNGLAGKIAGSNSHYGRRVIRINGKIYAAHRLAFLYMTGRWPIEIDHRDCDPSNNRWKNLREATRSQNLRNRKPFAKSGFKGVYYHARSSSWRAEIKHHGRMKSLGYYPTAEAAGEAYIRFVKQSGDEFSRVSA